MADSTVQRGMAIVRATQTECRSYRQRTQRDIAALQSMKAASRTALLLGDVDLADYLHRLAYLVALRGAAELAQIVANAKKETEAEHG